MSLLTDGWPRQERNSANPDFGVAVRLHSRNLLRDRTRVEALEEIYDEAMQAAQAVGGQYYASAATRLTELVAQAHAVLERQNLDEFPAILAQMKGIAEYARRQV